MANNDANEWLEGLKRIRKIVEGDWKYRGDVKFEWREASSRSRMMRRGCPQQGPSHRPKPSIAAIQFQLEDMKAILNDEERSTDERMTD